MDIAQYLQRIDFQDTPAVDYDTLCVIHRQHLLHIPYENYDVQLGRVQDFDIQRIFDKLVTARRGGWCYEMNGLLGWALQQIGFTVTRMSGAVMRATEGDGNFGNHLVLEVMLDEPYLADTGLGDGIIYPVPIRAGTYHQQSYCFRLEHLEDGTWRMHNHAQSNVASFDFRHAPADENELSAKCQWLQTDPGSPFTKVLIAQKLTHGGYVQQLGKRFSHFSGANKTVEEFHEPVAFNTHMRNTFGISEDIAPVWDKIVAAHEHLFAEKQK